MVLRFNHMVESMTYDLNLIFQALGDPTRRAILKHLSSNENFVSELAEHFEMSLAAVSKHIKVLERARLVKRRKEGSFYYFKINGEAMMTADQWIEHYRVFWQGSLDSLKNYIESEEAE